MTPKTVKNMVTSALTWAAGGASDSHDDEQTVSVACPACGSRIMADWRLCPYCGSLRQAGDDAVAEH